MSEREDKAAKEIAEALKRGGADAILLCILNHISDSRDAKRCETYWLAEIVRYACALQSKLEAKQ